MKIQSFYLNNFMVLTFKNLIWDRLSDLVIQIDSKKKNVMLL